MNGAGERDYSGRSMSNVTKPENRVWNPACECLPKKDLETLQQERLKQVVQMAWDKVPYYRAKMEAAGVAPKAFEQTLHFLRTCLSAGMGQPVSAINACGLTMQLIVELSRRETG